MSRPSDFMLTAEELRLRREKRRRLIIIGGSILAFAVIAAFTARPAMNAIKAFQARRHAARAFEFLDQEKWTDARGEALAAYQLRATEPQALRAVARYLTRTRQQQALEFWKNLRDVSRLTRDDLRDEATIAMLSGDGDRATQAVNDLLADNAKQATSRDWLIAAQLWVQKGQPAEASRHLQRIFDNNASTERELLQAAILELQASNSGDPETDRRTQADAWSRIAKLGAGKSDTALDALIILARRALQAPVPGQNVAAEPTPVAGETPAATKPVPVAGETPAATEQAPSSSTNPQLSTTALIAAIQNHPLAKGPQKLIALDLQMHENPAEKEACIARAIADWKAADTPSLVALATWLNGHGEFQRQLETIPLEKSLEDRDLFLQHLDALGALARWDEIKRLLEAERFPLDAVIQRMYLARCNAQLGQKAAAENNWQRAREAAGNEIQKLLTLASYAEKNGALDVAAAAYESAAAAAPKMRGIQQGRLRVAQAARDTKKIHAVLADMLALWPNDTAIQNDEAYTRLLLLEPEQEQRSEEGSQKSAGGDQKPEVSRQRSEPTTYNEELIAIEKLAEQLVQRAPSSLPHRTLLALARLKQKRPVAALNAYANVQAMPNALSPSALAVHAAVLSANGNRDEALKEIALVPVERLLPEEQAGTADLRPKPPESTPESTPSPKP
ncbi:MAG: hypothetical protein QOH88_3574 [Verrucomicrobiota bacterium]|jgi:hypothetical protein